jgi:photosystem II stability/assembly factor-like uncharacterized protein
MRLFLPFSIASVITHASPVFSTPDEVEWSPVNIPTEGVPGGWRLAKGSDVKHLTMATDGSLYAYANPSGVSHTLFKSTDGGYSWSQTGGVDDEIVDIATDPEDASVLYYASTSHVYRSSNGGESFTELPPNPGGAGSSNLEITTLALAELGGHRIIAVGTKDADNSEYDGPIYYRSQVRKASPDQPRAQRYLYQAESPSPSVPQFRQRDNTYPAPSDPPPFRI